MVAVRLSDQSNSTLGFQTRRVPSVEGESPGEYFKTGQWSKLDLWFDFDRIPARTPVRYSLTIFNLGAWKSDQELEAIVIELELSGLNIFVRPDEDGECQLVSARRFGCV